MNSKAGFTLLEVLVAVLIVAILATVVGVKVIPRLGEAKVTAAVAQITNFKSALGHYRLDNGFFPSQEQGLEALSVMPTVPPVPEKYQAEGYMEKLPKDPWGEDYIYLVPGPDNAPYVIISYGADKEPGGEGEAADISNLDI